MPHLFQRLVMMFWVVLGCQNRKKKHNLKNIHKCDKKNLITILPKTLTCVSNIKCIFVWCHTVFKELWRCFGWFLGCHNRKKEHNHKTIRKSQKHILTNPFFGNHNICSKRPKQIWIMRHPFKGSVTIS